MSNEDARKALAQRKSEVSEREGGDVDGGSSSSENSELWDLLLSASVVRAYREAIPNEVYSVEMLRQDIMRAAKANPKLLACNPKEVLGGAMSFAQLGLRPNSPLQHGWLVPIPDRRKGVTNCQVFFGYQGLEHLTYNTGLVANLYAENVYAKDTFRHVKGLHRDLIHEPAPLGDDRGEVIAYYTVADTHVGTPRFEVWSESEIIEHRDRFVPKTQVYSNGKPTGEWRLPEIWLKHRHRMAQKTVLRSMLKHMPKSTTPEYLQLMRGLYADGGIRTNLDPEAIDSAAMLRDQEEGGEFPEVPGVPHGATVQGEVTASPEQVGAIAQAFTKCGVEAPGEIVRYSVLLSGADPETVRNLPDLTSEQAAYVLRKVGACADGPDSAHALDQVIAEAFTAAGMGTVPGTTADDGDQ